MSGLFISFEGVEGAGKSTQIDLAVRDIRDAGHKVHVTREPGGCPLAERIRELILDAREDPPVPRAELFLLQAARAQHVERVIRPKLDQGCVVVCDRFYDSTIAYQGFARGLDLAFTRSAIEYAIAGVRPAVTIVLDLPPAKGLARQHERNRMENESLAFHEAVRRAFQEQARREPDRVRLVDASGTVEEVHARVMSVLLPVLGQI